MDVRLIPVKLQQRLNKLSSADYDNIECWQILEAFNKVQREWVRSEISRGEATRRVIDDIQILLEDATLKGSLVGEYYRTDALPGNYFGFNKLRPYATSATCKKGKYIRTDLVEEANTEELLRDWSYRPSFSWGETFHTIVGGRIKIYTNKEFNITSATLTYYRFPTEIAIQGCEDLDGVAAPNNINPEFKDDVVEMLIDKTASLIAGDIESWNQHTRTKQNYLENKQ